jgi:hypothetical protein
MTSHVFATTMILATWVSLAGPSLAPASGQNNQPIYPAYDGYIKNPDGSLTLAFGYFSHNREPVTIPLAPENSFNPAPADRQQPTVFRPGHQRFQCLMVVGPEFAGNLRWILSYAGTTTGTSERMLQYSWELVEGAGLAREIEYGKVPRGVCLNRAPVVGVLGLGRGSAGFTITLPDDLQLFGNVTDEGLPRAAALAVAWTQLSGPGTVTFSEPKAPGTRAAFSAPGVYELELSASDSEFTSRMKLTVTVRGGVR